jgi:hypothetical protein
MKTHEFVTVAAQIARRSNDWVHGELVRGPEHTQKDMPIEDRRRYCDSIREMLSWIEELR